MLLGDNRFIILVQTMSLFNQFLVNFIRIFRPKSSVSGMNFVWEGAEGVRAAVSTCLGRADLGGVLVAHAFSSISIQFFLKKLKNK